MSVEVRVRPAARRALRERLPEEVAVAVIEFITGPLAAAPLRVGRPLTGQVAGKFGARRGTYRIIYDVEVDVDRRVVDVVAVAHRSTAYRRR